MEETESIENSAKRTRIKAKSTPEKRTEKELRHLGISLKDVPTGGRAKRSSAKYLIPITAEKEPKVNLKITNCKQIYIRQMETKSYPFYLLELLHQTFRISVKLEIYL